MATEAAQMMPHSPAPSPGTPAAARRLCGRACPRGDYAGALFKLLCQENPALQSARGQEAGFWASNPGRQLLVRVPLPFEREVMRGTAAIINDRTGRFFLDIPSEVLFRLFGTEAITESGELAPWVNSDESAVKLATARKDIETKFDYVCKWLATGIK